MKRILKRFHTPTSFQGYGFHSLSVSLVRVAKHTTAVAMVNTPLEHRHAL